MKAKIRKTVMLKIERIRALLSELNALGYHLDFVEDSHAIVDTAALKKEMQRTSGYMSHAHVNTDAYVVGRIG